MTRNAHDADRPTLPVPAQPCGVRMAEGTPCPLNALDGHDTCELHRPPARLRRYHPTSTTHTARATR